jgi:hypothetical protein
MSKPIASLLVRIGADVSQLSAGSQQAIASMDRIAAKSVQVGKKLALLGAAATAAGAAFATKLTKDGLEFVDSQAKMARSIGATIDGLRGLQIAAGDAGIENVAADVQKLNVRLGEAARRGGPAKEMLDGLGLSANALMQMDADARLAAISDQVRALGLSSAETADMLLQLGIENKQLVDFMRQGGDAIRTARQEVDEFGLSISEVDAAQIEAANDAMARIGRVMEGVRNQFAVALAPILKEVADRFNNLAKANQGFGGQASKAAEVGIRAMAKFADVLQGLRVAFKGVELVGVGFKAAMVSVGQVIIEAFTRVADSVIAANNLIITGLNKLPGVDIATIDPFTNSAFMQGLRQMGEDARNEVGQVRSELHELAMMELPSSKAEEFLEAVQARARDAAEATVAGRESGDVFSGALGGGDSDAESEKAEKEAARLAKEEEAYRESLANRLLSLQEYLMSDEELAVVAHEKRLESLQAAIDAELIQEQEANVLREELEQAHMDQLAKIRRAGLSALERFTAMSYKDQAKTISSELANITAGVAQHSRKMFELNKAAGIANAILSAYEGIALTMSKYPYPINLAMAAAHAVSAFAQVNAIKSASFGGTGGVAPSLAGGTPAPATTPVSSGTPGDAGPSRSIFIQGISPDSLVSGRQVAELLEEFVGDGGRVVFGP